MIGSGGCRKLSPHDALRAIPKLVHGRVSQCVRIRLILLAAPPTDAGLHGVLAATEGRRTNMRMVAAVESRTTRDVNNGRLGLMCSAGS